MKCSCGAPATTTYYDPEVGTRSHVCKLCYAKETYQEKLYAITGKRIREEDITEQMLRDVGLWR